LKQYIFHDMIWTSPGWIWIPDLWIRRSLVTFG